MLHQLLCQIMAHQHQAKINETKIQNHKAGDEDAPVCREDDDRNGDHQDRVALEYLHQLPEIAPAQKVPVPVLKEVVDRRCQQQNDKHNIVQPDATPVIAAVEPDMHGQHIRNKNDEHVEQPHSIGLQHAVFSAVHSFFSPSAADTVRSLPHRSGRYAANTTSA